MSDNKNTTGFVPDDPIISTDKQSKLHQAMQDLKQDFVHLTEKEGEQAKVGPAQAIEEIIYPENTPNTAPQHDSIKQDFAHLMEKESEQSKASPAQAVEEIIYPKVELNHKPKPEEPKTEAPAPKTKRFSPENWKILGFLNKKFRRIFVVALIILLVLLALFFLRPTNEPIQSFDPTQPALTNKPNAEPENTFVTLQDLAGDQNSVGFNQANSAGELTQPIENAPNQFAESNQAFPQPTETLNNGLPSADEALPLAGETFTPPSYANNTPVKPQVISMPSTTEIKQATNTIQTDVFAAAEQANLIKPKARQNQAPAKQTSLATKTLVIHKGETLMQSFRNNHLKIADVIAMNKVNSRALSRFRVGDKVNVSLNAQGHVQELKLPNGARFVRKGSSYRYYR